MNDDLKMENIFPCSIFRTKRPDLLPAALEVFNENIEDVKNQQGVNQLYPVTHTNNLLNDSRLSELYKILLHYSWSALYAQGYDMKNFNTYFNALWGQEHQRGSSMEQHFHNSAITGIFILEAPKNSMSILFHDPKTVKIFAGLPETNMNEITPASSIINYTPEAGDIFLTNSWLPHSFTRNASFSPVKFLHFNINVAYNANSQEQPVASEQGDDKPYTIVV